VDGVVSLTAANAELYPRRLAYGNFNRNYKGYWRVRSSKDESLRSGIENSHEGVGLVLTRINPDVPGMRSSLVKRCEAR